MRMENVTKSTTTRTATRMPAMAPAGRGPSPGGMGLSPGKFGNMFAGSDAVSVLVSEMVNKPDTMRLELEDAAIADDSLEADDDSMLLVEVVEEIPSGKLDDAVATGGFGLLLADVVTPLQKSNGENTPMQIKST